VSFEFGICVEPVYYVGETRNGKTDLVGETAFVIATGPNGDRYHTGITRELSDFDYDFDGYATLERRHDADRRLIELVRIQEEFKAGIRQVDPKGWIELDPQMGSTAWTEAMLDHEFLPDTW